MTKSSFEVVGMHCASCASIIKRKLEKISGVSASDVNYATEKAEVTFSDQPLGIEVLNAAITPLGYSLQTKSQPQTPTSAPPVIADSVLLTLVTLGIMAVENLLPISDQLRNFFHHLMPIMASYSLFVTGKPYIRGLLNFIRPLCWLFQELSRKTSVICSK
jgi:copper chaperone CopZ